VLLSAAEIPAERAMIKRLFGKREGSAPRDREHSIEDLIVLERFEEAIERLQARVKAHPKDLHSHLRLADVLARTGQGAKALDEYLLVADSHTEDGFYDRALALLNRLARGGAEGNEEVLVRIARLERMKSLERSRVRAVEGLLSSQGDADPLARISPVEAQQVWTSVATSSLVKVLPGDQLKRLFSGSAITLWEKGETIAERDSGIERMFLVVRGQVEAYLRIPDGRDFQVRVLGQGDLFGERALLEHKPWPASYRAMEPTRLLRIDRAGLTKAMTGNPDPRQLLEALRSQKHDAAVASAAEKLLTSTD